MMLLDKGEPSSLAYMSKCLNVHLHIVYAESYLVVGFLICNDLLYKIVIILQ